MKNLLVIGILLVGSSVFASSLSCDVSVGGADQVPAFTVKNINSGGILRPSINGLNYTITVTPNDKGLVIMAMSVRNPKTGNGSDANSTGGPTFNLSLIDGEIFNNLMCKIIN